ncbi:hypothetical protein [Chakrabartyella piscis]|uniref:hypothetical protein n=1 Tax=Chakrabartyella piscis TaxID=2918914 RepID=UPI0029584AF4|nr:hypothetical protein [Chakrabartyella piscis]
METNKKSIMYILEKENLHVIPSDLELDLGTVLQKIKHILQDDTLSNSECLAQIDILVSIFEYLDNRSNFQ